ncbi:MAG TPA: cation-translocating P-type ATPase [Spirochaetia bacterium]|nr:cation-translocating P-type ATPase [Spirochaetia bacterium]
MHEKTIDQAVEALSTHMETGLATDEAHTRLHTHGPNELVERGRLSLFVLLWNQFKNFLVVILLVAAVVSLLLGEYVDAAAITAIILLNAGIGVAQDAKAEHALAALKKMAAPQATVIRDGQVRQIPARELVPGDVVQLEAGNYVPADLRLSQTANLQIEEASLTGESVPAHKDAGLVLELGTPLGDRDNMAFRGTLVTYGRGRGIVSATGMKSEIGKIASMLQSDTDEPTPLQRKLGELGKWLGALALVICAAIFAIGVIRDTDLGLLFTSGLSAYVGAFEARLVELFMTAVSLAIAAVPEGLPAVVTICLALGMQYMVKRHALIRNLPAVETLGSTTVICSDKTGTLTQNEMTVVRIATADAWYDVFGSGYTPEGEFSVEGKTVDPSADPVLSLLLRGALLCNDAVLTSREEGGFELAGDPTEGALLAAAGKAGFTKAKEERILPRKAEVPFDSVRKRMATLHDLTHAESALAKIVGAPAIAFVKGAPDLLLPRCTGVFSAGKTAPLTDPLRKTIATANQTMAGTALRVLAVAFRPLADIPPEPTPEETERELVFLGLLGMIDPPRPEAAAALRTAEEAGIKTVMVTGDYKETALAVAGKIGLIPPGGTVLSGQELDALGDDEFAARVDEVSAFARVAPEHKVRIVDGLKAHGHVVAMTGDGVNDAPALKRADIGVAMGVTGTDVSRETADVVLTDDNYASIVAAVEQGRIIYSNIRKFVHYLLTCNVGEILIIFTALLLGLPIPLTPVMLLMLNLATDGAPAIALGLEKGDSDIMKRPPRPPREPVVNRGMVLSILVVAFADLGAVLCSYWLALERSGGALPIARTVAFATLVCSELIRAFVSRSEHRSVLSLGVFSNRGMVWAALSSLALLAAVMYIPPLQVVFDTTALGAWDWLLILPFILIAPLTQELLKLVARRRRNTSR